MRRATLVPLTLLLLVLAAALPATAASGIPESELVPLTDPDMLEYLGYPPDAENVYLWDRPETDPAEHRPAAGDSGTAALGGDPSFWTASSGAEFHPLTDTLAYAKGVVAFNGALASLTDGGIFETQFRLPDGASLGWLDIAGYHNHASEPLVLTASRRCLGFFAGGDPVETVIGTGTVNDQDGAFVETFVIGGLAIDNSTCTYHLRARFGDAGTGPTPGVAIQISKARAQWSR